MKLTRIGHKLTCVYDKTLLQLYRISKYDMERPSCRLYPTSRYCNQVTESRDVVHAAADQ